MNGNSKVGGAPLLAVLCVAVVIAVFHWSSGNEVAAQNTSEVGKSDAPSGLTASTSAVANTPDIDLALPTQTRAHAIVCSEDVVFEAAMSHSEGAMKRVADAFYSTSVWNRDEEIRKAGCERWHAGIRIFNAHQMSAPLDDFVVFGLSPEGQTDHVTRKPHLVNVVLPGDTGRARNVDGDSERQGLPGAEEPGGKAR